LSIEQSADEALNHAMNDLVDRPPLKLPLVAWAYGAAGLIPFVGCAAADILGLVPGHAWWRLALLIYSAIILSFLGGARWGLALARLPARASVIALSMAPSIAGFFLLLVPPDLQKGALLGAALAHALQWFWDVRAKDAPPGYGRLRSALAAIAILAMSSAAAFG
jgi:hypothetical protein